MNIIEDFKNWFKTKNELLNKLIEIDSLIYKRLENIINILNYLSTRDLDDTDMYIFDAGFMYLNDQFMTFERYLEIMTLDKLENSSVLYNYLMDTIDFYEDANIDEDIKEDVQEYIEVMEALLIDGQPLSNNLFEEIEEVKEKVNEEYFSVTEIFAEISLEYKV